MPEERSRRGEDPPKKVGASLSMPGSISYKAKTIYRYNAGLHFNGNKNTSPCNDNVTMAMICSDEFRSSSQTRISDYSEKLPLSLSLGVAWESRFWSVSTDRIPRFNKLSSQRLESL